MGRRAQPERYTFFAGKGGVGKTTLAAATALQHARDGKRVLVVSTDPAHSLGDLLGQKLGPEPRAVKGAKRLSAAELDADRALERWLAERRSVLHTIAARGTYLDDDDIDRVLKLSLPGVDELIGLLELTRLGAGGFDEVVVDTAPTGHTLRLLQMPETLRNLARIFDDMQAKHRFLAESLGGRYRRDVADEIVAEIDAEAQRLHALLRLPARAGFVWVTLPEPLPLLQAEEGLRALDGLGIAVDRVIVNRVLPRPARRCVLCDGRRVEQLAMLRQAAKRLGRRTLQTLEARDAPPRGTSELVSLADGLAPVSKRVEAKVTRAASARARHERALVESLVPAGTRLLLVGGKGGVGKTSCAAALALELAARSPTSRILVLSTDPAHALGNALAAKLADSPRAVRGAPKNVVFRELDAARALDAKRDRYRQAIDDLFDALRGGSNMDASFDRQVVQDLVELAPPGLDELFGMLAILDALFPAPDRKPFDLVVVDTAPTGHTLRLLALPHAALEWVHALLSILLKYRQVLSLGALAQDLVQLSKELKQLQALLEDPAQTRFIPVTRPEPLPQLETTRLLAELERLKIPVGALLVNACTPAGCPRCTRAHEAEEALLARGSFGRSKPAMIRAPAMAPSPRGAAALRRFARSWSRA